MSLLTKDLLSKLQKARINFHYLGSEDRMIHTLHVISSQSDLPTEFSSNSLYIVSDTLLSSVDQSSVPCILSTALETFPALCQKTEEILNTHYQKEMLLMDFYQELMDDASYHTLMDISCRLMNNPVLLLDKNSVAVAQSGFQNGQIPDYPLFTSAENIRSLLGTDSIRIVEDSSDIFSRFILGKITHENQNSEFLCIPEWHTHLDLEEDLKYAQKLCSALSKGKMQTATKTKINSYSLNSLMLELLGGVPAYPSVIRERLKALHWQEYEKYYVLAIDKYYKNSRAINYSELQSILQTDLYEYKNYIVAILGCGRYEQINDQNSTDLSRYLRKYNMHAGLSHGFFDITEITHFFKQSTVAIDLNSYYGYNLMFCRYEDVMITHLLDICTKHNEMDLLHYCHPITLNIHEYDKAHDTQYLNTLAAYIFSDMSPAGSANTVHPSEYHV